MSMVMRDSFRAYVMAMERVEQRLRKATAALDAAGVDYAVVGGNAVAAWVAKVDPSATRTTRDVDLLVRRTDLDRITDAFAEIGFERQDLRNLTLFVDPDEPSRRSAVHLVWANERIRPSYAHDSPSITEASRDPAGFLLLDLAALVRMKLTSMRDIDRVHIADLLSVDLIDAQVHNALPPDLASRLRAIEAASAP